MATETAITLHEDNDETLELTVTPADEDDDLTLVDSLELYLKEDACFSDLEAELVLTSDDPSQINILTQTADEITAEAFIPASALDEPYNRFWRLDALTAAGLRRTALFGPVILVDL